MRGNSPTNSASWPRASRSAPTSRRCFWDDDFPPGHFPGQPISGPGATGPYGDANRAPNVCWALPHPTPRRVRSPGLEPHLTPGRQTPRSIGSVQIASSARRRLTKPSVPRPSRRTCPIRPRQQGDLEGALVAAQELGAPRELGTRGRRRPRVEQPRVGLPPAATLPEGGGSDRPGGADRGTQGARGAPLAPSPDTCRARTHKGHSGQAADPAGADPGEGAEHRSAHIASADP